MCSTSGIATRRTSCPPRVPGDMHSVNKANFAILRWFGLRFEPRFTHLEDQLQALYCADDPVRYEKCLIRPVGQIDQQLIISEKPNIDQIVATLGLKQMTQGTLVRKLCTYTAPNPTRRAVFEFAVSTVSTRCATCGTRNLNATCIARKTASSPTTNCARPSRRSVERRN